MQPGLATEASPAPAVEPDRPAPCPEQVPYLTIRPSSGWAALDLRDLWRYRDLLLSFTLRDVKLRYKQTALGVIWVVLQPLLAAGVFSFVFGAVARLPADGRPYFLFSYAGLLGWNLFNNTLTKCGTSLSGNSHLVTKIFFPRLVLPFSTVPSALIDFGVGSVVMVVLMVAYRTPPTPALLLLPVWTATLILLALGPGLCAAALAVPYRDVTYVLPVLLQILLYASPIAYALSAVPPRLRGAYLLNPVSAPLEAFRWSLLGTPPPPAGPLAYAVSVAAACFVIGCYAFRRMERKFADVI